MRQVELRLPRRAALIYNNMQIELAFGKTGLPATLPQGVNYQFLEARSATALPDGIAALEAAMDSPIGTAPLVDLARGKKTAAISVCDITRPAPNRLVLPPLLARLQIQHLKAVGDLPLLHVPAGHRCPAALTAVEGEGHRFGDGAGLSSWRLLRRGPRQQPSASSGACRTWLGRPTYTQAQGPSRVRQRQRR